MPDEQPGDPLHGITLKAMLEALVARHTWSGLAERIPIACFENDPSLSSSLKFLRKTEWARAKVERLYLADERHAASRRKRNARRASMRAHRASLEEEVARGQPAAGSEGTEVPDGPES